MEIACSGHAPEIYKKIKTKLSGYLNQGKLKLKDIVFDDRAHEALATGTGFKSKIRCRDGKVIVDLDLNFLLRPLRGQIEDGIRKNLTKVLS